MNYLEALWIYQQADQQADQYEAEIRRNPMRKKLVRLRDFYKEQQEAMRLIENGTKKTAGAIEQAQEQYMLLSSAIAQKSAGQREEAFETSSQLQREIAELNALISKLSALKKRVDDMSAQCKRLGDDLRAARENAGKAKNDYAQLKEQYDSEFAVQSEKLEALKTERDERKTGIPPDVLSRYEAIKRRCTPAMAPLDGDKCAGCNMSLPAVIITNAKKAERIVECDTCGRIIYIV